MFHLKKEKRKKTRKKTGKNIPIKKGEEEEPFPIKVIL